jgi:hypothetical protein
MSGDGDEHLMTPWPEGDDPVDRQRDGAGADNDDESPASRRGGVEFAELHRAQRLLQDRLAGAAVPAGSPSPASTSAATARRTAARTRCCSTTCSAG